MNNKEYWDSIYELALLKQKQYMPRENFIKIFIKKFLGEKMLKYIREYMFRSYSDYLLWDVIYKKYMPKTKNMKVLEAGSAPGGHLVRLNQTFGFIPYGIEYSESGVELNRKIFTLHNINPDNVIYADFLSDEFHKHYREYFDIVISRGFIEHFDDVDDIIEKHINLLNRGGYLFITVPNVRGINYILGLIFNKEFLSLDNINIMQKREFSNLFDKESLSTLFCNYYGTFDFSLFSSPYKKNFLTRFTLSLCNKLQLTLNVTFRLLFRGKGAESRLFSPYLIFVGKKKA